MRVRENQISEVLIGATYIWKPVSARLQGPNERNCRVLLGIPEFPHPLSCGGHHGDICVHPCFDVDGPQLLSPTGDPSHPVWLRIKSQSYSTISENLWTLELIPGEIIKVRLTWIAYGIVYVINYFMVPGWQSFQKATDYTWEMWTLWMAQREMHWAIMSKTELSQPRRLGKVPWCQGIIHTFC